MRIIPGLLLIGGRRLVTTWTRLPSAPSTAVMRDAALTWAQRVRDLEGKAVTPSSRLSGCGRLSGGAACAWRQGGCWARMSSTTAAWR
jgi:hypothetical protein